MTYRTHGCRSQNSRRGLSLLESVIVLMIVAAVLAGIWVAAAAVTEQHRINQAVEGTLAFAERARQIFGADEVSYAGGYTNVVNVFYVMKFYPDGFIRGSGGQIKDPWHSYAAGGPGNVTLGITSTGNFIVGFQTLGTQRCNALVSRITRLASRDRNFVQVYFHTTGVTYSSSTFPLGPTIPECATNDRVWFYFRLV